ncbi:hypothetical protein BDI4_590073 [Burkholderia diffusa]|nr:hypothetical protein BDI4_590073 [Burkholderia diffusa]
MLCESSGPPTMLRQLQPVAAIMHTNNHQTKPHFALESFTQLQ